MSDKSKSSNNTNKGKVSNESGKIKPGTAQDGYSRGKNESSTTVSATNPVPPRPKK